MVKRGDDRMNERNLFVDVHHIGVENSSNLAETIAHLFVKDKMFSWGNSTPPKCRSRAHTHFEYPGSRVNRAASGW